MANTENVDNRYQIIYNVNNVKNVNNVNSVNNVI